VNAAQGWPAPAKLNLFLHITGRRPDGYHLLQTVFQFLDYGDILYFEVRSDGRVQRAGEIAGIAPQEDLTVRAACLLQQAGGTPLGVDIHIDKRLPLGGGLGGGSSDAATTLVALNRLWGLDLPTEKLAELALKLGADVPVFVHGRSAWAEGVGETLTFIDLTEPWFLVIIPPCHVPTAEIFAAPELTRNARSLKIPAFLDGQGINVCEEVVRRRYPDVDNALNWLSQYSQARMSGTGACVFAPFTCEEEARRVLQQLPTAWHGFVAKGLNRSPLLQRLADQASADQLTS
jgi:4-diphosphocytidyl-2-C-methyl-D-erythritol kinase